MFSLILNHYTPSNYRRTHGFYAQRTIQCLDVKYGGRLSPSNFMSNGWSALIHTCDYFAKLQLFF
jgi:hypothetical protein